MLTGRIAVVRSRGLRLIREVGLIGPDDKDCELGDVLTIISEGRGKSGWTIFSPIAVAYWRISSWAWASIRRARK